MRSLGIVVTPPAFDQHLGFVERGEDLSVEKLIPELAVEAFIVAVFPRAPWRDVEGIDPNLGQPLPHRRGHELRAIVRADMIWWSVFDKEVGQTREHIIALEPTRRRQGQALLGVLIDHRQDTECSSVVGAILDKVVTPDVAGPARPETNAGSVI